MKRNEPCAHMRPDYDRMEEAVYIFRHPITDEITWPPCRIESELARLGLINQED